MKHVAEYINNQFLYEDVRSTIATLVCEALQSKILKEVAKQLLNQKNEESKAKEEERKREEEVWGHSYTNPKHTDNKGFKEIFGPSTGHRQIEWDKLTDDNVTVIDNYDAENNKKLTKEIRTILKGDKEGLVVVYDTEKKLYKFVIFTGGTLYSLHKDAFGNYRGHAGEESYVRVGKCTWKQMPIKDRVQYINGCKLYIFDITGLYSKFSDKKQARNAQKEGMIYLDDDSLYRLAEANRKRYKDIVAQNKANRINNDALLDEAAKIVAKAAKLAVEVAKDPTLHADVLGDISTLMAWMYGERRYVSPHSYKDKGYYTGVDGILRAINSYSKSLRDVQKGNSYDFERIELDTSQQKLKVAVNKAKEVIDKIESKM